MKMPIRILSIVLCLCLCVSMASCKGESSSSSADDSYLEGLAKGKEDLFMRLWNSAYDLNAMDCGEMWKTDDFSLILTPIRKTEVSYEENAPYIEIDFILNESTIERQWKSGNLQFYIYSVSDDGMTEVGNSEYFYDYFEMGGTLDGNKGHLDVLRIYEETDFLRVVIVMGSHVYAASFSVDI